MNVVDNTEPEAFLTRAQCQDMTIQHMIFHVVGRNGDKPILLDEEVAVGDHESFFLDRVKDTARGAKYHFLEIAGTRDALALVIADSGKFVEVSRKLAKRFQSLYDNDSRLSDGVLLVLQIRSGTEILFATIKFDLDPGVIFDLQGSDGARRAELSSIQNLFSRHKSSMQKSALIRILPKSGEVCAIDRSGKIDLTAQFQNFLDVQRTFDHAQLTQRLFDAVNAVACRNEKHLPDDFMRGFRHRTREALRRLGEFDPENPDPLKQAVFGGLSQDNPIHKDFEKELRRRNMSDEPVRIVPEALPPTRRLLKETREGIQVYIPEKHQDRVTLRDGVGGEKELVIRTMGLTIDDIELEKTSKNRI